MTMNYPTHPTRILAIPGSVRRGSYNLGLLRAAAKLAPPGVEVTIHELGDLPFYDPHAAEPPASVAAFKRAIEEADALLIATPEYNHSVPGVLKNALDWASRPAPGKRQAPLFGKPTAIMGATVGVWGTVRAQWHLRQILAATGTPVVLKPEVLVAQAKQKFDSAGTLTDEQTCEFIRQLLDNLLDLTWRLQADRRQLTPELA